MSFVRPAISWQIQSLQASRSHLHPKANLWLKVPVNDASTVQVVKCLNNATCVESSCLVVKVALVPQDGPEFPSKTGLHQHVEELTVFERFEQLHDELAVRFLHDFLF